jgi:hypothetical protein
MLLVLGDDSHLFFKKLGEHLLLLVARVHIRPGKWTNTCRRVDEARPEELLVGGI